MKTIASTVKKSLFFFSLLSLLNMANATNTTVSTNATLQTAMGSAMPGDTVTVANGTYNWGLINITNNNGTSTSAWIVLRAATFNGVIFTGSTYLKFKGMRLLINGFKFANGNSGANSVIQFRNNSNVNSDYCRITNITIDNYNSAEATGNNWVALYGTHHRVDHCTFINKTNQDPTVSIVYDNNTIPQKSTSTYHLIDSNYFNHMGYLGSNEGETIRLGTSYNIATDGYNIVEYNLFENGVQADPEVISNKSCNNTFRYNTLRNTAGGITLRRGRRCSVYSNFIIRDSSSSDYSNNTQYGIRIFENGHRVYNNYIEGVNYSKVTINKYAAIDINNGESPLSDTNSVAARGNHFPADSCIVAFNTIVNAVGGHGMTIGYNNSGTYTYQLKGAAISYNLIKMTLGSAVYNPSTNTSLTDTALGNMYQAPSGLAATGIVPTYGFSAQTLTFNYAKLHGMLVPPSLVANQAVRNDSVNRVTTYNKLMNNKDITGLTRGSIYDVGCLELTSTGIVINEPLTSCKVGAGTPNCSPRAASASSFVDAVKPINLGIKVYPNPASSVVMVDVASVENIDRLILVNVLGQTQNIVMGNSNRITIPVSKLSSGVNYIQVVTKDRRTINYPFVVSK